MNLTEKNEKLVEILQNEQFKLEAQSLQTAEDFQALLAKNGLELSLDEVYGFCAQVANSMNQEELSEDALDDVAGGVAWVVVGAVALGVACVGSFAVGVYNGYKSTRKK